MRALREVEVLPRSLGRGLFRRQDGQVIGMTENEDQPAVFRNPEDTPVEHPEGLYTGTVVDGTSEIPGPHVEPSGPGSQYDDGPPEQRSPREVYESVDMDADAEPAVTRDPEPKPDARSGSQSVWAAEHEDPESQETT